jgi:hypothetical protein
MLHLVQVLGRAYPAQSERVREDAPHA